MLNCAIQVSPALRASIENLYAVFARYPLPLQMECCKCGCNKQARVHLLYAKPLRELEPEHLDFYSFSALYTMGDVADFKHFLPRIFELGFAVEPSASLLTDLENITHKLPYAKWLTWPAEEQEAIRRFFRAFWTAALAHLPTVESMEWNECEVDRWLCSIAQAESDLTPYLEEWMTTETLPASVLIASVVLYGGLLDEQQPGSISFWDNCRPQLEHFQHWLRSAPVAEKLERAAFRWAETEYLPYLEKARKMLG